MHLINRLKEAAATGYILIWLLGIPIPIFAPDLSAALLNMIFGKGAKDGIGSQLLNLKTGITTRYEILYEELRCNGVSAWLHWNALLDRVLLVDASHFIPSGRDVGRAAWNDKTH
jgi:hypothetical protein